MRRSAGAFPWLRLPCYSKTCSQQSLVPLYRQIHPATPRFVSILDGARRSGVPDGRDSIHKQEARHGGALGPTDGGFAREALHDAHSSHRARARRIASPLDGPQLRCGDQVNVAGPVEATEVVDSRALDADCAQPRKRSSVDHGPVGPGIVKSGREFLNEHDHSRNDDARSRHGTPIEFELANRGTREPGYCDSRNESGHRASHCDKMKKARLYLGGLFLSTTRCRAGPNRSRVRLPGCWRPACPWAPGSLQS
jgi:hypothetical protein